MTHNPPPPSSTPTTTTATPSKVCGNCSSSDRWILHSIKLRGTHRKLCTSCVLKLHPTSFCPSCFSLHDIPPPSSIPKTLTCFKCSSLSHITCAPPNAPKSPYLCPPCSNPLYKFFNFQRFQKAPEDGQAIDVRAAKVFLAAARIAAISMNKAAAVAKVDADRRVKEAAVARKRAKEAMDNVMVLSAKLSILNKNGQSQNGQNKSVHRHPVVAGAVPRSMGAQHLQNGGVKDGSGS